MKYSINTIHDYSINDFLTNFKSDLPPYVLITSLDSETDLTKIINLPTKPIKTIGKGLLFLTSELPKEIFFGFDEIWFFYDENIPEKPEIISIVGPNPIRENQNLIDWMDQSNCYLGLGDGEGLNYILRYPILQPEK